VFVVANKKLTNNCAGLVTSGLGLEMARGPPGGRVTVNVPYCPFGKQKPLLDDD
jgi:hypothetical protein